MLCGASVRLPPVQCEVRTEESLTQRGRQSDDDGNESSCQSVGNLLSAASARPEALSFDTYEKGSEGGSQEEDREDGHRSGGLECRNARLPPHQLLELRNACPEGHTRLDKRVTL